MEIDGEYSPIPISISEDYLSKFRTPKIREIKYATLYSWGIKQEDIFDPFMEEKIKDYRIEYDEYKDTEEYK